MFRLIIAFLAVSLNLCADQTFSFYNAYRNKVYTVTTQKVGQVWQWPGHWQYQPSVVTPSTLTNNQYVMLFNSNLVAGQDGHLGEAIFMATSSNGTTFSYPPSKVLDNTGVGNLCDMADARPIWDGSQWHVYVQAVLGNYHTNLCSSPNAVVVEATGPSLSQLSWVVDTGNNIRPILTSPYPCNSTTCGISEEQQWFNTLPYGGATFDPILATYNDWNYSSSPGQLFASRTPDGTNLVGPPWYNAGPAFSSNGLGVNIRPDVMLAGSLDYPALGSPAIAVSDGCNSISSIYSYGSGIGFFPDPYPYTNGVYRAVPPSDGTAVLGPLDSQSSDSNGPHMFRPRLARNPYGFIEPTSNSPKRWQTYLYYNDRAINILPVNGCGGYGNYQSSDQGFSVSSFTITEVSPSRVGISRANGLISEDVNGNLAWDVNVDRSGTFGQAGDIVVRGDWNGSGTTKIGIYRPSTGLWMLDMNGDLQWDMGDVSGFFGGQSGDIPLVGDWTGDGKTKVGIYRPSSQSFSLDINANLTWDSGIDQWGTYGISGDIPIIGDWTGDGRAKIGIFRPSSGLWALDVNANLTWDAGIDTYGGFGQFGDSPILGDWNGDGKTKVGIYRSSTALFSLDYNGNLVWDPGTDLSGTFGIPGDTPIVGDWTATGVTRIGIFRAGTWSLDVNGNIIWESGIDATGSFGVSGDQPLIGHW